MNRTASLSFEPGRIGFDIDGVVADTAEAFIRLARRDYGFTHFSLEDITRFEVEECLDMPVQVVMEIFNRLLDDPVGNGLKPMDQAVPVLSDLAKAAPLTFITARPREQPIADWLTMTLGEEIVAASRLVAMGDHDGKAEYIRDFGLRCFVDDRVETCLQLDRAGVLPLVYEQPWNRHGHGLPTVGSWREIGRLCEL